MGVHPLPVPIVMEPASGMNPMQHWRSIGSHMLMPSSALGTEVAAAEATRTERMRRETFLNNMVCEKAEVERVELDDVGGIWSN
jgi:hypothetical protein